MTRLIEIYSRFEAIDGFLALMLQQPNSPTAQQPNSPTAQQPNSPTAQQPNSYRERMISERITVNATIFDPICHFHARYITGLISLTSFYLSRIEGIGDKNRVLH